MADAVISIVVERVAAIIEDQIRYEVNLVRGVEKEVLNLSDKLETIKNVLDDAEKRGVNEQRVKNWLKKLEDVAYEMDDILDEWNYTLLKHKMGENQSTDPVVASAKQKVCCSFIPSSSCLSFNKVVGRRDTAKKIENVKDRLDQILKEKDEFNFVMSLPSTDVVPKSWRVQSTSLVELDRVYGRGRDRDNVVSRLMHASSDSQLLCIVGMGGLGKTTLAQLVYNDSQVKDYFESRIWICVSDPFDVAGIASGIVASVAEVNIPRDTNQLELVLEKLRDCISGKKFLLVLDDVWTEDYNKWEPLKIALENGAGGSKILVTTRNERVAKMMGTLDNDIYRPQQLTDEECWIVLRRKSLSGRRVEECGEFEDLGKKIASKCKGLPLAAIVLGSILQFKNSLEEWTSVLESEIWRLEEAEVDLFPHLVLSYNELSPALKRCFSYCAIYPKDSRIDVKKLIEEWMALGYLGSVTGNGGVELKGLDYVNNLAMRSLFHEFKKSDDKGEQIEWCKMHDIVHDFALFLRKRSCQFYGPLLVSQAQDYRSLLWSRESPADLCDRLTGLRVLNFKGKLSGTPKGMEKLIHLRWLQLSFTVLSEKDLKIICRLYFLQTLLLYSCLLEEIPGEIGNLAHLRHLDLSENDELKELPESMCSLVELRILNIDHCSELHGLPEGMHRLQNLQHLYLKETPLRHCLPRVVGQLSSLRTLRMGGFHVGSHFNNLELLKNLNCLTGSLKLEIHIGSVGDLVEDAREARLRNKIHIQKLKIYFKGENEWSSSLSSSSVASLWMDVIEALEPHHNLKKLHIQGYEGSRLPHWISSPLYLIKEITLYDFSELSSLPPMGKLPFLEVLKMQNLSELKVVGREFLGIESSSSSTSHDVVVAFPKLKKLTFTDCDKWEEWEDLTAEEEREEYVLVPSLTKLKILSCTGLKKLPHNLLRKASSSLQVLKIKSSSELQSTYGDENGSPWRSISQNNPQLRLHQ